LKQAKTFIETKDIIRINSIIGKLNITKLTEKAQCCDDRPGSSVPIAFGTGMSLYKDRWKFEQHGTQILFTGVLRNQN
jgi:hypothetical protein